MRVHLLTLGLIAAALGSTAQAEWLPFDESSTPAKPRVTVLTDTPSLLHLRIHVPGAHTEDRVTPLGIDTYLEIPNHGHTLASGAPAVPVVRFTVEIPFGASLEARAIAGDERTLVMDAQLYPVQPPQFKNEDPQPYQRDDAVYRRAGDYPGELVRVVDAGILRGHRLALVEVFPIAYDPVTGQLRTHSEIDVAIEMTGADVARSEAERKRYYSPPCDQLLSNLAVNHETFLGGWRAMPDVPIGLLIITADMFEPALGPLVDWKTLKGYHTRVATLSETGSTKEQITAYIENEYLTGEVPPTWVLLVGDTNTIPYYTGSGSGTATDLYFGTLTGSDYLPEVHIGRFPVRTMDNVDIMIEKVVDFEKLILANGIDFFNVATWIASSDMGAMAEDTHEYVIANYFPPEMEHIRIYETQGGSTQDIRNAVNGGTVICNYSGHGSTSGWGCVPFDQTDVRNLSNLDLYPFVISNACITGTFNNTECYGETWVLVPNKGATAHFGSSANTLWDEDDILEKRLWQAFWQESYYSLGGMCDDALLGVWEHYGGGGYSRYYFECYNIMGDPSMDLWATYPDALEATYLPVFLIGMDEFTVDVTTGGAPLDSALVCLNLPGEVYETAYTDALGQAVIAVDPAPEGVGTMYVTVTKHDHDPHFGSTEVLPPSGPYVVFHSCVCDDGEGGNGDGGMDAGETVAIEVTLENVGADPAVNVTALLALDDPYATALDNSEFFGTIPAGGTRTCYDAYVVRVASSCPDEHVLSFELEITGADRITWEAGFNLVVDAPVLEIVRVLVDDTATGNGNGLADPGEDVDYRVFAANSGHSDAMDVDVTLVSTSGFVTVTQDGAGHAGIPAGTEVELAPVFELSVSSSSPEPQEYLLWFEIGADWGYTINIPQVLPVGGLLDTVENGEGGWTHAPGGSGFVDQWHVSSQRNHTPDGTLSWKQGDTGGGNYANLCDGCLVTEPVPLGEVTRLRFWHWMQAEVSGSYQGYCYDGGLLEISVGGGSWTQITPEGGYPYLIRTGGTSGPFPAETPVYSGELDWTEAMFVLEGLAGTAQFRFRFGSDGATTDVGWYVDDVQVSGASGLEQEADDWKPLTLRPALPQNAPNPFGPATTISFQLPRDQEIRLQVFDTGGRLVRKLANGRHHAGLHHVSWNGMNDAGQAMPTGVYYCRLNTEGQTLTRSMRLLR